MSPVQDRRIGAADALIVLCLAAAVWIALPALLPAHLPMWTHLVLAALALPFSTAVGMMIRRRSPAAPFAPGRLNPGLVFWVVFGTAVITLTFVALMEPLLKLFPKNYGPELERLGKQIFELPPVVLWVLVAGIVPFCEEALFRGALLKGFRNSWGTAAALAVSSMIFAAFHILPPRMVVTLVLGFWFGILAVRSGGLLAPVLGHGVNNGLALFLWNRQIESVPVWMAVPGTAAGLLALWGVFRSTGRSMQGSAPPGRLDTGSRVDRP
jgi:membrane protease YdiL (CAAX protease family)